MHVPPQIEGRGNGIKTNVVNNVDIAKALERPPECECACGSRGVCAGRLPGSASQHAGATVVSATLPCHWRCRQHLMHAAAATATTLHPGGNLFSNGACFLMLLCLLPSRHSTHMSVCLLHGRTRLHTYRTPTAFLYPTDILKFYGCELGAQTNFDKNTGTSIVNGAHDTKKLCELLEQFIKK